MLKKILFVLMLTIIILALSLYFTSGIFAQEPTRPTVVYEYQIKWSESPDWEPVTMTSMSIADEAPPTTHLSTGVLGTQTFKAKVNADNTDAVQPVATMTFDIAALPDNDNWDFYQFRWGAHWSTQTIAETVWSIPSNYVEIGILALPGQPAHQ